MGCNASSSVVPAPVVFEPRIEVFASAADMCAAAELLITQMAESKEANQKKLLSLALSGGSTPKLLYKQLRERHEQLMASRVHFLFGDVRMVPDSSSDSNYAMAYEALLHAVPSEHVTKIATTDITANDSAAQFEAVLRSEALGLSTVDDGKGEGGCPQIDVVLLGVGPDGHTASLFPNTAASREEHRLVVSCMPNPTVTPLVERVTITRRVIQAAKHVVVLATGKDKGWVLDGILAETDDLSKSLAPEGAVAPPVVRLLRGCKGHVHIFVDAALSQTSKLCPAKL